MEYNEADTDPISDLEVYFNFILDGADGKEKTSYEVLVDLTGFVFDKRNKNAFTGLDGNNRTSPPALFLRIEYVNFLIARNLQVLVEEWFDSLEVRDLPRKPGWVPNFNENLADIMSGSVPLPRRIVFKNTILFSSLFLLYSLDVAKGVMRDDWFYTAENVVLFLAVFFCGMVFLDYAFTYIANRAWPRGHFPVLILNLGSARNHDAHERLIQKKVNGAKAAFYTLLIGVGSSLLASLLMNGFRLFST